MDKELFCETCNKDVKPIGKDTQTVHGKERRYYCPNCNQYLNKATLLW